MSLLEKLWDDTVAGPRPESGLGKLRKHSTFNNFRSNTGKESDVRTGSMRSSSYGNGTAEDAVKVTRSIMIMKPPQLDLKDSPPVSPAGSTTPGSTPTVSPFGGSGGREAYRFRRRSASFAYEKAGGIGPRNPPPPYDL